MTAEQSFFIQILADFINQKQTNPAEIIDWTEISRLAHSHHVDGIIFSQCKDYLADKDRNTYERAYIGALYYSANLKYEYQKILKTLNAKDIFFFPVKGFHVSAYYPVPELRMMSDCDIIIKRSDMAGVQQLMRNQGYQGIDNIYAHSWECRKNSFLFEFHDRLVSGDEHTTESQKNFFNIYDPYVIGQKLEDSFHFLYLLIHLRKHFMISGVGIRQFMDIAVLIKNETDLNWRWIEEKLLEIRLMPFAQACFFLVRKWFGVTAPIETKNMDEKSYEQVTIKILRNGIFGGDDPENAGNYQKNLLMKARRMMWLRRILMICNVLFPSYQHMRSYPECGFLDGRPVLLPLAWIKRFLMLFRRNGFRKVRRIIHNSMVSFKAVEKQEALLRIMGLH